MIPPYQVQARWGNGKFYGATIKGINSDGTVKIMWEAKSKTGKNLVSSKVTVATRALGVNNARQESVGVAPTLLSCSPSTQVKMESIVVPDMPTEDETIDDVGASK